MSKLTDILAAKAEELVTEPLIYTDINIQVGNNIEDGLKRASVASLIFHMNTEPFCALRSLI